MSAYPNVSFLLLSCLDVLVPGLFSLFSTLIPLCLYLLSGTAGGLSSSKFDGGRGGGTFLNSEGEFCGEPHGETRGELWGETFGDARGEFRGELRGEFLGEFQGELNGDDLEDVPGVANGDAWVTTRVGDVGNCGFNVRFRLWGKGGGASSEDGNCSVFSCCKWGYPPPC